MNSFDFQPSKLEHLWFFRISSNSYRILITKFILLRFSIKICKKSELNIQISTSTEYSSFVMRMKIQWKEEIILFNIGSETSLSPYKTNYWIKLVVVRFKIRQIILNEVHFWAIRKVHEFKLVRVWIDTELNFAPTWFKSHTTLSIRYQLVQISCRYLVHLMINLC